MQKEWTKVKLEDYIEGSKPRAEKNGRLPKVVNH